MGAQVLVKVSSHRARGKLRVLLGGELPKAHYSLKRKGNWHWIPKEKAKAALAIPSISEATDRGDLVPCWNIETTLEADPR